MPEQIHADFAHDFLRGVHHQPVIAERCERTAQVHHTHADDRYQKSFHISRLNEIVDERFDQICAADSCTCTYKYKNCHKEKCPLVMTEISQEVLHGLFLVSFGLLYPTYLAIKDQLLPSVIHIFPDRSDCHGADSHVFRLPPHDRRP